MAIVGLAVAGDTKVACGRWRWDGLKIGAEVVDPLVGKIGKTSLTAQTLSPHSSFTVRTSTKGPILHWRSGRRVFPPISQSEDLRGSCRSKPQTAIIRVLLRHPSCLHNALCLSRTSPGASLELCAAMLDSINYGFSIPDDFDGTEPLLQLQASNARPRAR